MARIIDLNAQRIALENYTHLSRFVQELDGVIQ